MTAEADRDELARMLQDDLLPQYKAQAGFIEYTGLVVSHTEFVGLQVWETQEEATSVGAHTGDEVREKIGGRATLTSWYHGPVIIEIPAGGDAEPAYGRVGIWDIAPETDQNELIEKAREGLMPIYQQQAGLVSYWAMLSVEGRLIVMHTWKSEADARQGMQATGEWLQETLANRLALIAGYDGAVLGHARGSAAKG